MYCHRTLETFISKVDSQFPVLLVTGPRQVGKTTLLQQVGADSRSYVTLDDPLQRSLAQDEPALFLQRFQPPVLLDEIQYAPQLLPYIKMHVDRERTPGQFWLTGSQHFHLMQEITESLAGRVGIVHLQGLSQRELAGHALRTAPFLPGAAGIEPSATQSSEPTLHHVYHRIWRGSFPVVALDDAIDRDLFYGSYVQTYLQRDIRDLTRVGDEMVFLRFLRAAAARTGQLLNLSDLARDADISPVTAKNWLSILQTSGIVYLLEPYHSNVTKRLVKTPKLYFLDTGLCAYLTGWSSPETLEAGAMSGAILETWVVGEILKSYWHTGKSAPLYFYRDKDKQEIDLLIVQDGTIFPVEIKKTAAPRKRDIRHFGTLARQKRPIGAGAIICLVPTIIPLSPDVQAIPVTAL